MANSIDKTLLSKAFELCYQENIISTEIEKKVAQLIADNKSIFDQKKWDIITSLPNVDDTYDYISDIRVFTVGAFIRLTLVTKEGKVLLFEDLSLSDSIFIYKSVYKLIEG